MAGRVKTRLAAELGAQQACDIHQAFLADLVAQFHGAGGRRFLCYAPDDEAARAFFERLAGSHFGLWPQPEGDLGVRLQRFFDDHVQAADDLALVIGSDSPTLPAEYIDNAFSELARADCVIGPATDGGYYLIGMRGRTWPVFSGIEWGTGRVLEQTVERLRAAGARLAVLPVWYDVDTLADWKFLKSHVQALDAAGSQMNLQATRQVLGLGTENLPAPVQ